MPFDVSAQRSTRILLASELNYLNIDPFDLGDLRQSGALVRAADGRGTAWFVQFGNTEAVLRHYYRGGLAGKVSRDRFVWFGAERSRAFAEYRLLLWMRAQGLPVPEPLGARVERSGVFCRCDLLTRALPNTQTLAQCLKPGRPTDVPWEAVGAVIRRFHDAAVWHADLNAKNILLDNAGGVFLIDFDRCRRRTGERWKEANLQRLRRSLHKLASRGEVAVVDEAQWGLLIAGYQRA